MIRTVESWQARGVRLQHGRLALVVVVAAGLLAGLGWSAAQGGQDAAEPAASLARYQFEQVHMGTSITIVLYAADRASANQAAEAAYDRVRRLDELLSDYNPQSELSRLSRTAGSGRAVPVSQELWLVMSKAQELAAASQGAFDVTVGPYIKLWRRARRTGRMPDERRMAQAREVVGYQHVKLNEAEQSVELTVPGMRLDLGGIAMGYAADEALAVLARHGITRAMVDASGDIVVGDAPPGRPGWTVGLAGLSDPQGEPDRFVVLCRQAITTSGDAFQFVVIDGTRYSHLVDPHSGVGLTEPMSVTVVATDCITADSLATAVSVLGPQRGMDLLDQAAGAAVLFARNVDGRMETVTSSGFERFLAPPMASQPAAE